MMSRTRTGTLGSLRDVLRGYFTADDKISDRRQRRRLRFSRGGGHISAPAHNQPQSPAAASVMGNQLFITHRSPIPIISFACDGVATPKERAEKTRCSVLLFLVMTNYVTRTSQ